MQSRNHADYIVISLPPALRNIFVVAYRHLAAKKRIELLFSTPLFHSTSWIVHAGRELSVAHAGQVVRVEALVQMGQQRRLVILVPTRLAAGAVDAVLQAELHAAGFLRHARTVFSRADMGLPVQLQVAPVVGAAIHQIHPLRAWVF